MKRLSVILVLLILVSILVVGCGITTSREESNSSKNNGSAPANEMPSNSNDNNSDKDKDLGPDTPVSSEVERNVIIESPGESQLVESGKDLVIQGKTRLQKFSVEIEDGHDILGTAQVDLTTPPEIPAEFEVTVKLKEHTSPSGVILIISEDSTSPELIWPIKFE